MIDISTIVAGWPKDDSGWSVAPEGYPWIAAGLRLKLGDYCTLGDGCTLGDRCTLGDYCTLGNYCTLRDRCTLGDGCTLGNYCTLGDYCKLGDYCTLGNYCKLGYGCTLGNYCKLGYGCKLGNCCTLGYDCTLGSGCRLGDRASDPLDLGHADGYRKAIACVDGVAYIGAGCRWFTLEAALVHWGNHREDRTLTLCLMQSALAIAKAKGWRTGRTEACDTLGLED